MTSNSATLRYSIDIKAPQKDVFRYLTDWEKQKKWVFLTNVRKISEGKNGIGTKIEATTGLGRLSFVDSMTITDWIPPVRCVVEHTGKVVKGYGIFTINESSATSCQFIWEEITPLPFGRLGRVGFYIVKPLINVMFNHSLKKLKKSAEIIHKGKK